MLSFFASRIGSASIAVLGVSLIVFLLIHIVPGDPVEVMLGETAQPADRAALRAQLGLDQPLATQIARYYGELLSGNLGASLHSKQPVLEILLERMPATIQLAAAALGVALIIAIPLGVLAAVHKGGGWDRTAMGVALIGVSMPHFWLGPVLILVFSLWLGWLPVSGREAWSSLVLPALTLGSGMAAILSRMVRASLLEVLQEDYVRTARAKGLSQNAVVWRHAMRNALLPVVTVMGLQFGALLGGAVVTETVFAWPGVGQLTIEAIQRRDYPVVQACVLLISVAYVLVNTFTDFAYAWLDPRVHPGSGA